MCAGRTWSWLRFRLPRRRRGYVRYKQHPGRITTREVLQREWEIVCMARDGIRRCAPLCSGHSIQNASLDSEQRQAVERILQSRDFVTLFRGGAGTGKSYTLREVYGALRQAGHTVIVVAPQRQQVMDLERDGFQGAQTVSAFLARGALPRGGVLLVDEAGQIGGRQMHQLLSLAQANEGRVILSGDTRQHGAVEASDALRAIEKYSTLQAIELTDDSASRPGSREDTGRTRADCPVQASCARSFRRQPRRLVSSAGSTRGGRGLFTTGTSRASCPALSGSRRAAPVRRGGVANLVGDSPGQ